MAGKPEYPGASPLFINENSEGRETRGCMAPGVWWQQDACLVSKVGLSLGSG